MSSYILKLSNKDRKIVSFDSSDYYLFSPKNSKIKSFIIYDAAKLNEILIKKYLKQHEYVTISQVEQICEGLEAKQPFSRNKAVVKDKRDYAKKLVEYMLKTNQLEQEGSRYKMHKK